MSTSLDRHNASSPGSANPRMRRGRVTSSESPARAASSPTSTRARLGQSAAPATRCPPSNPRACLAGVVRSGRRDRRGTRRARAGRGVGRIGVDELGLEFDVIGHDHIMTPRIKTVFDSFNPFDPGEARDAWPRLARMRDEAPVVEIANGMQYVTRHSECRDALGDPRSLSNATGMKAPGVEVPFEDRLLGELDPPRHTLVRRVMVTALSPKLGARGRGRSCARPRRRSSTTPLGADRRLGARVHRSAPQPHHRAHARSRPGRRRPTGDMGEGPDGEHVPGTNQHRAGRGLRGCASPSSRCIDERIDERAATSSRAPHPMTCLPACSNSPTTASNSPAARSARWCAISSPAASPRRASSSATCCT